MVCKQIINYLKKQQRLFYEVLTKMFNPKEPCEGCKEKNNWGYFSSTMVDVDDPPLNLDPPDEQEDDKMFYCKSCKQTTFTDEMRQMAMFVLGITFLSCFLIMSYTSLLVMVTTKHALLNMEFPHSKLQLPPQAPLQAQDLSFEKDISRALYYSWAVARETNDKLNAPDQKVISCYYNIPGPFDKEPLVPANIQSDLCTHINIAFARVVDNQIMLDGNQIAAIKELVKMKIANPDVKLLLSVGGSGNDDGFAKMVKNHANRKVFIKSIKYTLRNYSLDGVDLDWEFPGVDEVVDLPENRERQHFSQLLREIRTEYSREKRNYMLTVAVAAPEVIVDAAYDVDQLNMYTDYVNLMTYDYHFFTKYTPFTGLNSPLFPRPTEQLYMATLNVNYTVHMYLKKGLDKSKIVVGIPAYGHTFKLVNPENPSIGSPASDYGFLGHSGFVDYNEMCRFVLHADNATIVRGQPTKVPYLYWKYLWVSYDDPHSVIVKAQYINEMGLRGAMIYSLNADDHLGICEGDWGLYKNAKFPLLRAVKAVLESNSQNLDLEYM